MIKPIQVDNIVSSGFLTALFVFQCLIAFSFLYLIPNENDRYRINSLRYFRAYFLMASVGYLAYVMRLWLPFNISVVLTNFFVLSSAYCVVLGLLWRYKRNIHFYYFPIVLHVGIYTLTQLILGILYPDEPMYRLILIYINLPAVFLFALSLFNRYKEQSTLSDKVLKLTLFITVVNILAIPIFYLASDTKEIYLSYLMLSQNLVALVLFGAILFSSFADIIAIYKSNATKDPVTGLHNQRSFLEQADQFLHAAERHQFPMTMIVCHIDDMKNLTDKQGYFAGDAALQTVAKLIKKATRKEDLISRFGASEFVLLLPQTRINGALLIAERMRLEISQTLVEYEGDDISLTASLSVRGIDRCIDIGNYIRETDAAARNTKLSGGNRVVLADVTADQK